MKPNEGKKIKALSKVDAINYLKGISCLRQRPDCENYFVVGDGKYMFWVGDPNIYYAPPSEKCLIHLMDWSAKERFTVSFENFICSAPEEVVESFSFHLDMFR